MSTMFYRVGWRAEAYPFTPFFGATTADMAEQAAADYWHLTGFANSQRPLQITLLDENGRRHGIFDVAVVQPPVYRATPTIAD